MIDFLQAGDVYSLDQRAVASITMGSEDSTTSVNTQGSLWILGFRSSGFLDETISVRNVEAWAAGGHKSVVMTGQGLIINNPGLCLNERKLCSIQPGKFGQLSYIDGCNNSNMVDPARNGDPCINYLYFPPGIDQTWHTHPSVRVGFVVSGSGVACIKNGNEIVEHPLEIGRGFVLHRHAMHRFQTNNESDMSLMVYHPDSEDGPRDEANPMKTRTYLR
jgi:quercetin dioxygenase-like cupin family protein